MQELARSYFVVLFLNFSLLFQKYRYNDILNVIKVEILKFSLAANSMTLEWIMGRHKKNLKYYLDGVSPLHTGVKFLVPTRGFDPLSSVPEGWGA